MEQVFNFPKLGTARLVLRALRAGNLGQLAAPLRARGRVVEDESGVGRVPKTGEVKAG